MKKRLKLKMPKIYAIFDFELNQKMGLSIDEYISLIKRRGALYLQYRDKINSLQIKQKNLFKIRKLWDGVLIINDEIELVFLCDGLHLGQEDLLKISLDKKDAVKYIRDKIGSKILGISTHNIEEIKEANELNIDYIGLGAYRNTSTKDVSSLLGDKISHIASFSKHPVVAIGGMRVDDNIENISFNAIGLNLYEY